MTDREGIETPSIAVLLALADRCEREEASRDLDFAIMLARDGQPVRAPSKSEKPWLKIRASRAVVPLVTSDLNAARSLSGWLLAHASDIDVPMVRLSNSAINKTVEGYGGRTLILTWVAAALRACAADLEQARR